ncbi:MAG TPA: helicase C-terminal domain-containing protein [Symbiobacteriaceae bacterium]|nr:helicase C-terminal domain-containing protein [Symbiobacteriaceae bacterium]
MAIDFETTGLEPGSDRIIEVGAVRYEDGVEVACLSQLIDPQMEIPLRIQNLTGILPVMVKGKPTFQQIAPQLKELLGDLPVVAHNAPFDMSFLQASFGAMGIGIGNPAFCTAELARVVLPRAKNHRLATLVKDLEVELERHHRAEDDARACGQVYLALVEAVEKMDVGLLRFILNVGEPGNWSLAPIFRKVYEAKEARGEKGKALMQWIRPFDGNLHQQEEPAPEGEPSGIDPAKVTAILGPGGVISDAFPSYEHRPSQLEMAQSVAQAFNKGSHLLMEAGTGTGKSLAYLVPAIAWAKRNGEKVAIATHTINLQEQLWEKDIPFLKEALAGTKLEGFKAALVKGRPNYICLRKWEEEATASDFLTSAEDRSFLIRLTSWLSETETGDKAELNLNSEDERLWTDVMSEAETCLGPRCKWFRSHCFAYRARSRAREADIMVLNHAMLFADINTGNEILPAYRHLILDEAHHVEDVATNALGIRLENYEVFGALTHLFRSAGQGFLPTIRRRIPPEQRIAARPPVGLPSEDHLEKLIDLTLASKTAADELFRLCAQLVESKGGSEEESGRALRLTEYVRMGVLWEAVDSARANAVYRLRQLGQGLAALAEAVEAMEPPLRDAESLLVDIQKQSGIVIQSAKAIDGVLLKPADDVVTWIEVGVRRDSPRVVLRSAPIDVGELLREKVFEQLRSVVMTSATLSVSGGFDHVKRRLGLVELPPSRVWEGIMSSPFVYNRQALLLIPEDLANPKLAGEKEFTRAVREFLAEYVVRAGGRTLVLFTSHRQLRQVYNDIKDDLESEGIFLLGQGLDGSRGRLVEEFKTAEKAVLFGSASFWEGVDIPGDGLTSVILVKLPFSPPDEPVMEARTEDLEKRGLSSFAHLSLPQAVIKFKQGFGRLVRTRTDRGVVIVLDNRISPRQTRYGSQFLRSLPGPAVYSGPTRTVIERALAWLKLEAEP